MKRYFFPKEFNTHTATSIVFPFPNEFHNLNKKHFLKAELVSLKPHAYFQTESRLIIPLNGALVLNKQRKELVFPPGALIYLRSGQKLQNQYEEETLVLLVFHINFHETPKTFNKQIKTNTVSNRFITLISDPYVQISYGYFSEGFESHLDLNATYKHSCLITLNGYFEVEEMLMASTESAILINHRKFGYQSMAKDTLVLLINF